LVGLTTCAAIDAAVRWNSCICAIVTPALALPFATSPSVRANGAKWAATWMSGPNT
jgi:hypothetical protein